MAPLHKRMSQTENYWCGCPQSHTFCTRSCHEIFRGASKIFEKVVMDLPCLQNASRELKYEQNGCLQPNYQVYNKDMKLGLTFQKESPFGKHEKNLQNIKDIERFTCTVLMAWNIRICPTHSTSECMCYNNAMTKFINAHDDGSHEKLYLKYIWNTGGWVGYVENGGTELQTLCKNIPKKNRILSDLENINAFLDKLHEIFEIEPHYDVHMGNILVKFHGKNECVFKIIDFDWIESRITDYENWLLQHRLPRFDDTKVRSHRENLQCLLWLFLQGGGPINHWYYQYPPEINMIRYWAHKSVTSYETPANGIFYKLYPTYEEHETIVNTCFPIIQPFVQNNKVATPQIISDIITDLDRKSINIHKNDFSTSVPGYGACAGFLLHVFNDTDEPEVKKRCLNCIASDLSIRKKL